MQPRTSVRLPMVLAWAALAATPLAAQAPIDIDAQESHLAQLPQPLARQGFVAVLRLAGDLPQFAADILARQFLQLPLLGCKLEWHCFTM